LVKRVLVVDDHEPWRQQVRSMLHAGGGWQVVGEATNGLEAIQAASTVAPDLSLLDVDLPALSGIEAARHILALNAHARILFVSAHMSWDVAEAALATGARGYVVKYYAAQELLTAMDTVIRERRFVSVAFGGPPVNRTRIDASPRSHEAGFYADDGLLLERFAWCLETALKAGQAVVIATVQSRQNELHHRLQSRMDIDPAIREGRVLWLNVAELLSSILVDGWPDEQRFWNSGTSLMMRAARASHGAHPRVTFCGEGTGTLVRAGAVDTAIRLEQLWDDLAATFDAHMLCGFPMEIPRPGDDRTVFDRLCSVHTAFHSA
jgi:CheY-like chemotaxis protein